MLPVPSPSVVQADLLAAAVVLEAGVVGPARLPVVLQLVPLGAEAEHLVVAVYALVRAAPVAHAAALPLRAGVVVFGQLGADSTAKILFTLNLLGISNLDNAR